LKNFILDIDYIDNSIELKHDIELRLKFFSSNPILIRKNDSIYLQIPFHFKNTFYIFDGELHFNNTALIIKNQKLYKFSNINTQYIPIYNENDLQLLTSNFPFYTIDSDSRIHDIECNFIDDIISSYKYQLFGDENNDNNLISCYISTPCIDFTYNNENCKLGLINIHINRLKFYLEKNQLRDNKIISNFIKSLTYTITDKSLPNLLSEENNLFCNEKICIDDTLNLFCFYILDKNMKITKLSHAFYISYPFVQTYSAKCNSLSFNKETNVIILCIEETKKEYKCLELNMNDIIDNMKYEGDSFSAHELYFSSLKPNKL
jgi:hypothetical protein